MTTPQEIITQALKKSGVLGVGQTALAEDINDGFTDLNDMLAQWQRKRWLVYHLITMSFTSTGAQSYTIGPSGNFNVTQRPDKIDSAFFRQINTTSPNQVDYPLKIIDAREDYNRISLKGLVTFPEYLFYDTAYPMGLIYPWPVIQSGLYELFITIKEQLTAFTSLAQSIILPPEYMAALKWNLAARLRPSYQMPADPQIIGLAKDSLNVIRNANAQIPTLKMPAALTRRGIYNIYSDFNY